MTMKRTVLLLYPGETVQSAGQAIKQALEAQDTPVVEMVIGQNYAAVLDQLEQPVIPVVVN